MRPMTRVTDDERWRWMIARAEYHERLAVQLRWLVWVLAEDPAAGSSPAPAFAALPLPRGRDG